MLAALLLLMPSLGLAGDYCRAEIESACPDRPSSELAACLKDPSEHDKPTTISSECTDFVAVNVACADTIEKFCDGNFFSADTALCLTQWTDQQSIPAKCAGVLKWAIPKEENQDDRGPTDELGLSEKDYQEKKAWQAKRKAERGAAVEKMRETDKEKREMERLKREHPEDYEVMMKEKEERAKEIDAQRKRERLVAAAKERKRREEAKAAGELEEEPEDQPAKGKRRVVHSRPPPKRTWLPYALFGCGGAFVFFNVLNWFYKGGDKEDNEDKEE